MGQSKFAVGAGAGPHANVIALALTPFPLASCLHPDLLASCHCDWLARQRYLPLLSAYLPAQEPPRAATFATRSASRHPVITPKPTTIRPGLPLRLGLLHFMLVELIVACQLPLSPLLPPDHNIPIKHSEKILAMGKHPGF